MEYNNLFINYYTSRIPELFENYNDQIEICENLAYVFCGIILIPYVKGKYLNSEFEVLRLIMLITNNILEMDNNDLTGIVRLGFLESLIPERELFKSVEYIMPEKLFTFAKRIETQLGW